MWFFDENKQKTEIIEFVNIFNLKKSEKYQKSYEKYYLWKVKNFENPTLRLSYSWILIIYKLIYHSQCNGIHLFSIRRNWKKLKKEMISNKIIDINHELN